MEKKGIFKIVNETKHVDIVYSVAFCFEYTNKFLCCLSLWSWIMRQNKLEKNAAFVATHVFVWTIPVKKFNVNVEWWNRIKFGCEYHKGNCSRNVWLFPSEGISITVSVKLPKGKHSRLSAHNVEVPNGNLYVTRIVVGILHRLDYV